MTAVFDLDHTMLAADSQFTALSHALSAQSRIDSTASFNHYCREACRIWKEQFGTGIGKTSAQFIELLGRIEVGAENVIQTSWGGVAITRHEHPRVEKYLVVRQGGYLALEMHEQKDEHLDLKEGAGLILFRRDDEPRLVVQALTPGDQFHFEPGREHCIIGTENLLIFERSTDPKGMDQDLVFFYEPIQ